MLSMEQMYQAAMKMPDQQLLAVLRGQNNMLPQAVAEAALRMRKRMQQSAMGQQAQAQQGEPTQKDKLLAEYGGIANLPAELDMSGQAQQGVASFAFGGAVRGYADGDLVDEENPYDPASPIITPEVAADYRREHRRLRNQQDVVRSEEPYMIRSPLEGYGPISPNKIRAQMAWRDNMAANKAAERDMNFARAGTSSVDAFMSAPAADPAAAAAANDKAAAKAAIDEMIGGKGSASSSGGAGIGSLIARPTAPTMREFPKQTRTVQAPTEITAGDVADSQRKLAEASGVEKPKTADDYMAELYAMQTKYGVNRDPYAKFRQRLEREDANEAGTRRRDADVALLNFGLGMLGSRSQYAGVAAGRAGLEASQKYEDTRRERDKQSMERAKALADIEKANSDIARGDVAAGYARLKDAQARYDDAMKNAGLLAGNLAGHQMQARTSLHNTAVGAESADMERLSRETQASNVIDMQRYQTDSHYAAAINNAITNARAMMAAAQERRMPTDKELWGHAVRIAAGANGDLAKLRGDPKFTDKVLEAYRRLKQERDNPGSMPIGMPNPYGNPGAGAVKPGW